MLIFYVFMGILYLLLMVLLWANWQIPEKVYPNSSNQKVSVLVPFRNEIRHIAASFHNLKALQYPDLEIIWIDDFSDDGSSALLEKMMLAQRFPIVSMRLIKSGAIGKKAALTTGLELSKGEIIMTTDADSIVPMDWVRQMTQPFFIPEIKLVAGPVMTNKELSFFQKFQQIEWASILALTYATFYLKKPLMCSGANLAYRKSAFLEVQGYEGNQQHLSGDDEFLLKKMLLKFGDNSSIYLKGHKNLVYTQEAGNWDGLFQQRIRWASKWNVNSSRGDIVASLTPFFLQLVFLSSIGLLFMGNIGIATFLLLWFSKVISERIMLGAVLNYYHIDRKFIDFMFTSLVHPFYVVATGLGAIRGKFTWKGRGSSPKH